MLHQLGKCHRYQAGSASGFEVCLGGVFIFKSRMIVLAALGFCGSQR